MTKKDFWDLTNKPQTKIKLNILKDYLTAWAKIFAKQKWCREVYFIDCCAGRGKYCDQGKKDVIEGSPLIVLNIAKEIKAKCGLKMTCFFIEEDPGIFKELENFVNPFKSEVELRTICGDINGKIVEILNQIPKRVPIFFFIDPAGINIKSETIKKMLEKPNIKEFLITYIQKGVERCLGFGKKTSTVLPLDINKRAISNLIRIEDFFGLAWSDLSKDQKENLKKYLHVFIEYNRGVAEKYKLKSRTIDILYNLGRNKYYLIFISRNEKALKIIEDIFTKIKLNGTLFTTLPYKDRRRMFQGKFDI